MEISELARGTRQILENLQRAGVTHLPRTSAVDYGSDIRLKIGVREGEAPAEPIGVSERLGGSLTLPGSGLGGKVALPGGGGVPAGGAALPSTATLPVKSLLDEIEGERLSEGPKLSTQEKVSQLQILQNEVAGCTRCKELADTRTQTVFGVGSADARLVFLGEAPGATKTAQGEPFVGRAGQLLTDMITKGMQLRREDVYILNVLKCRPPGNRNPAP